jgi:hypothetical protein
MLFRRFLDRRFVGWWFLRWRFVGILGWRLRGVRVLVRGFFRIHFAMAVPR